MIMITVILGWKYDNKTKIKEWITKIMKILLTCVPVKTMEIIKILIITIMIILLVIIVSYKMLLKWCEV